MTDSNNSQQNRPLTTDEQFRKLFARTAKLNDAVSALLAPAWGSKVGIIPSDHPLYVGEESSVDRSADAPTTAAAEAQQAGADDADTCRSVDVDGEPVLIRGHGDFTEQDTQFFAEIVRAAKRRYAAEHGSAVDEDAQRTTRRRILHNLLDRLDRHWTLSEEERALLRQHVEAEISEAAVLRGDVKWLGPSRRTWKGKAEEIEQIRDNLAAERDRARAAIERVRETCQGVRDRRGPGGMINATQILGLLSPTWPDGNYAAPAPNAALDGTEQPTADQEEQAALVDWQAIAKQREHELKRESERRYGAEQERDGAYRERAHLVALLAAMTDDAVIAPAPDVDEPGWQIVYLTIGGRQASWHISPRDAELFQHVTYVGERDPRAQWDGHTTEEKYSGIAAWTAELAQDCGPACAEQHTETGRCTIARNR